MTDIKPVLLDCPFCGGEAGFYLAPIQTVPMSALCSSCLATVSAPTMEECAAAWNRRQGDGSAALREALTELVRIRDWVVAAGGTEGPLPADVIRKFAEMQAPAIAAARAALTPDRGEKT